MLLFFWIFWSYVIAISAQCAQASLEICGRAQNYWTVGKGHSLQVLLARWQVFLMFLCFLFFNIPCI